MTSAPLVKFQRQPVARLEFHLRQIRIAETLHFAIAEDHIEHRRRIASRASFSDFSASSTSGSCRGASVAIIFLKNSGRFPVLVLKARTLPLRIVDRLRIGRHALTQRRVSPLDKAVPDEPLREG